MDLNILPSTEIKVPIRLGDRDYTLYFNANTMCAYEEQTHKFFLDTVSNLLEVIYPDGLAKSAASPYAIMKKFPMVELRALLWAAVQEYDEEDNPSWPLTIGQVGKLLTVGNILAIFSKYLKGTTGNNPTKEEAGESLAGSKPEVPSNSLPKKQDDDGGEPGIALPVSAFDSITVKSDG